MMVRQARSTHREVSPLELFFDLVFVLAIGQLTHHLVDHLTWHGAAETLVALVAVCGVWAFTTFEVTLLDIERTATRAVTITVMGLGLFMGGLMAVLTKWLIDATVWYARLHYRVLKPALDNQA